MLAQRMFRAGHRTALVLGIDQLSTRMYASLGELVRGWRKNVYAGGINALPSIPGARLFFPLGLLAAPVMQLLPPLALLAHAAGLHELSRAGITWAATTTAVTLVWWAAVYLRSRRSPLWTLLYPLGAAVLLWICVGAIARGRRVAWKGRSYRAT
jgi:chlorobactene glucosyltransferase